MDGGNLSLPPVMRSVYSAFEVVNMLPVFSRGKAYETFLKKNEWVFSYLPNAKGKVDGYSYKESKGSGTGVVKLLTLTPMVQLSKFLQQWYMGKRREESFVSDRMLGFYPQTFHEAVLHRYKERLSHFGIDEI